MTPQASDDKEHRKLTVVDRRRVGRDDSSIQATEPNLKPSYVEEMEERVALAERKLRERIGELDEEARKSRERVAANLEYRFRERETALLLNVLDILDDLERATEYAGDAPAVQKGMALVADRIGLFLEKHGCERFSPEGEPFDPNTMEALQLAPGRKDVVCAVLAPGIRREGDLLRPARVAVGNGGEGSDTP